MLTLTKLSAPGFTKTYDTYEEVLELLERCICSSCRVEARVQALLDTACGAEYMLEDDYDQETFVDGD